MFWWAYDEKSLPMWKFVPVQMHESAASSSQTSSERNYDSLLQHCTKLEKENQLLKNQLNSLQKKLKSRKHKKIKRRPENQLTKNYHCLYSNCKKEYASSLALNLHMKIKHNAGSKRDRLLAANQIIRAEAQGRTVPQVSINLPPNYLQNIKTQKKTLSTMSSEQHSQKISKQKKIQA